MLAWIATLAAAAQPELYGATTFRAPSAIDAWGAAEDSVIALSWDGQLTELALPSGEVRRTVKAPCEYPSSLAVAPSGDRIALMCGYEEVRVLTWPSLQPLSRTPTDTNRLAFSRDGKTLAVPDYEGVAFVDAASGKRLGHLPLEGGVRTLVEHGGTWFVGSHAVRSDGVVVWSKPDLRTEGAAFSADGKRLLVVQDRQAQLLDPRTGDPVRSLEVGDVWLSGAHWTPSGWWIAESGRWLRFDPKGEPLPPVEGETFDAQTSTGGRWVLVDRGPRITGWAADGSPLPTDPFSGAIHEVVTADGQILLALNEQGDLLRITRASRAVDVLARLPGAYDLALSPDAGTLAVAGEQTTLIDTKSGETRPVDGLDTDFAAYAPDGALWLVGVSEGVRAWSIAPGASRAGDPVRLPRSDPWWIGIDPTGTWMVLAGESRAEVAHLPTGLPLREWSLGEVWGVAIDGEGRIVLGTHASDRTRVSVAPEPLEGWDEVCCSLHLSPDGRFVLVGEKTRLTALAVADRRELGRWTLPSEPDDLWLVTPSLAVVELADGRLHPLELGQLDAPPAPGEPVLKDLDLAPATSEPMEGPLIDLHARHLAWPAEADKLLLADSRQVTRVDPRTGATKTLWEGWRGWGAQQVAAHPDGRVVLLLDDGDEKLLGLTDAGEPFLELTVEHHGGIAFAGDRILHGGDRYGEVVLRDTSGKVLWTVRPGRSSVEPVALAPDVSWAVVPAERGLTVLSMADGAVKRELSASSTCEMAVDPRGRWLATSHHDGSTLVWNTRRWQVEHPLDGLGRCADLAFSPDGSQLATVGDDRVVIWDLASGEATRALSGATGSVAWGPSGLAVETVEGIRLIED